jgi:hypothetical protein
MNVSFDMTFVIYNPLTLLAVYRVNWIRARSRRDRWQEELSITSHEMVWIVLWFQTQAEVWRRRAQVVDLSPGFASYAYRQSSMWDKLKQLAAGLFHKVHEEFSTVFGYGSIIQG